MRWQPGLAAVGLLRRDCAGNTRVYTNHMRVLLALLCVAMPPVVAAQEATVTYKDNGSGFVVTAKDGSASYELMLGSCWPTSLASTPALAAGRASLSIGVVSIGSDLLAPRKIPAVDGAIGMDLLANMALGFDLYNHKLAIWPRGTNRKDALTWVSKGEAWDKYGTDTVEIPLDLDSLGLP